MTRKALSVSLMFPELLSIAKDAGEVIMPYYQKDVQTDRKADNSPVTQADREADALITQRLATLRPDIPCVSEEGNKPDVTHAPYFWLVDPLDGTKGFVSGKGHFTVNIGLIGPDRIPVAGVIYDPVDRVLFWGGDGKAFRMEAGGKAEPLSTRGQSALLHTAIVSHSHLNAPTESYLQEHSIAQSLPCSSSIKFCRLAEGKADIYPRFGPTMEWDTAAGHAILTAAGGSLTTPGGTPYYYGKPDFENGPFIARKVGDSPSRPSPTLC